MRRLLLLALCAAGGRGDSFERSFDPGDAQYKVDACTACRAAVDAASLAMAQPASGDPTSELRAAEIMDRGLCGLAIGPTRGKCDRFVEEHEEELQGYIRSARPDAPAARRRLCGSWCGGAGDEL
eukprot:TRINITY_DN30129_c0_g1_i2.p3 TRINITY_DN30129_c0_g1~~TRINITY_DN30129_c0_g1_i2.p3  ORF type:complete len:125 (+),score=51.19 TRINITY_DN30129_c0_g1_i2:61-435(+)